MARDISDDLEQVKLPVALIPLRKVLHEQGLLIQKVVHLGSRHPSAFDLYEQPGTELRVRHRITPPEDRSRRSETSRPASWHIPRTGRRHETKPLRGRSALLAAWRP